MEHPSRRKERRYHCMRCYQWVRHWLGPTLVNTHGETIARHQWNLYTHNLRSPLLTLVAIPTSDINGASKSERGESAEVLDPSSVQRPPRRALEAASDEGLTKLFYLSQKGCRNIWHYCAIHVLLGVDQA